MTSDEATGAVIRALHDAGIPFMLVGSLSSNFYGVARASHDADFVVALGDAPLARVAGRLGPDLRLDPQITFESVTGTTRYRFELRDQDFTIEVFLLSSDPHDRERFARRVPAEMFGVPAFLPTPEDVIVMKLRWYVTARRRKDRDDVVNLIAVQREKLDLPYVRQWCERHGSLAAFEELLAAAPRLG
ncbi:MAG: hypothetical protein JWO31_2755 [Phycisphaerales bacterium]|nr:hypothetical protein [Phycisphaerales bacterium]